ncbi:MULTISPECIES: phage gp6-like head-tail connector protein [Streptomyces]|uniref:Phage gp6-like head-tail connector protein n=2 Tax=Streptomyces TaxID=1883 RepID=A0ABV9ITA0_9ACTN
MEDHCGRDLDRRLDRALEVLANGSRSLRVPPRYQTFLSVSAVEVDGQAVTGWAFNGRQLTLDSPAGWPVGPVTLWASWGFPSPPASLRALACSEVIRWLALSPGIQSEKVGEVEVTFSGASSTQTLSALTRSALKPYRRRAVGTLSLRREGPHGFGY